MSRRLLWLVTLGFIGVAVVAFAAWGSEAPLAVVKGVTVVLAAGGAFLALRNSGGGGRGPNRPT